MQVAVYPSVLYAFYMGQHEWIDGTLSDGGLSNVVYLILVRILWIMVVFDAMKQNHFYMKQE